MSYNDSNASSELNMLTDLAKELFSRLQANRDAISELNDQSSNIKEKETQKSQQLREASDRHDDTFRNLGVDYGGNPLKESTSGSDSQSGNSSDVDSDAEDDGYNDENLMKVSGRTSDHSSAESHSHDQASPYTSKQKVENWRKDIPTEDNELKEKEGEFSDTQPQLNHIVDGYSTDPRATRDKDVASESADSGSPKKSSCLKDSSTPLTTANIKDHDAEYGEDVIKKHDNDEESSPRLPSPDSPLPSVLHSRPLDQQDSDEFEHTRALNEAEISRENLNLRVELQRLEVIEQKLTDLLGKYDIASQNVGDGARAYLREYSHASQSLIYSYEARLHEEKMLQKRLLTTRDEMMTELKNIKSLTTQANKKIMRSLSTKADRLNYTRVANTNSSSSPIVEENGEKNPVNNSPVVIYESAIRFP